MASVRVGSVEAAMGRPEEALRNYESAVRLYQDALRDDPSSLELRRQLAIAYGSEGNVLSFRLRAKEALAAHGKALEVQEAIARERPDEVKAQIDVARTRGNMALAHRMLGENSAALAEWDRAVAIATPLLDKPLPPAGNATQDLTGRTDLSRIVREVLGGIHLEESHALLDLNRLDEARRHAEAGRALFDGLTRDYPTDLALKASLSTAYSALSAPEREAGLLEEANRDMLRCLEILDALTAENPTVLEYRTDLAYALLLHGYVLERLDKPADADATYRRLMNVAEALFSTEPGSARTRNLLAQALQKRAGILIQAHRLAEALPLARRGVELLESLVREQPDSVYNRSALGAALRMLGLVEAEAGLTREAFTTYERALDAQRPLIDKLPVERYNQACALAQMSRLVPPERRDTQAAAAVQMLGQALADGYSDAGLVATDTDLDPLRGRADFKALLAMHGISQRR
jgi:tetratricopeptide (TPR) repeat protein